MCLDYPEFLEKRVSMKNGLPSQPAQAVQTALERDGASVVAWFSLLILCVVVCTWWSSLNATFVLDDQIRIIEEVESLDSLWSVGEIVGHSQRPVVRYSLAINYAMGGLEPAGYHAFNFVFHSFVAILLFMVVRESSDLLRRRGAISIGPRSTHWVALAIALVWAIHPLQTASVTYVIQRAEVLAGFFGLLAVYAQIRSVNSSHSDRWLVCMLFGVGLAIASKPTMVFLPAILLLFDGMVIGGGIRAALRARGGWYAAALVLVFAILWMTGVLNGLLEKDEGLRGAGLGVAGTSSFEYAWLQLGALGLYAWEIFDPSKLSIDHGKVALEPLALKFVGMGLLLTMLGLIAVGVWKQRWWAVLPACFLVMLAPTSSVLPLADPAADHRMYLPLAPIMIGVVSFLVFIAYQFTSRGGRDRIAFGTLTMVVLIVLSMEAWGTNIRNAAYQDPSLLWSSVLERRPDHVRGLVNRAAVALNDGDLASAKRDLLHAEEIEPGNPNMLLSLARVEVAENDCFSALERVAPLLASMSDNASLHAVRGDALRGLERQEESLIAYQRAIAIDSTDPMLPLVRGNVLSDLGRLEEAADSYRVSASLAGSRGSIAASAFFNIGNMHFRQERFKEAAESYGQAMKAWPDHPWADDGLAEANRLAGE